MNKTIKSQQPGVTSLNEAQFTKEIVIPLLSKRGATHIVQIHGADEDGKDLVFLTRDFDGSDILNVAQVKHAEWSKRTLDYDKALQQLRECKQYDVAHPITKLSRRPDRVWLISGYELPHQRFTRAQHFLEQLTHEGAKLIDAPKLCELLKETLPDLYTKYYQPTASFDAIALPLVSRHDEVPAIDPARAGTITDVYVDVNIVPVDGYFSQLFNGHLYIAVDLPHEVSESDRSFCNWFARPNPDLDKFRDFRQKTSPRSVTSPRLSLRAEIARWLEQLQSDFEMLQDSSGAAFRRHLKRFLHRHLVFEASVSRFDQICGAHPDLAYVGGR